MKQRKLTLTFEFERGDDCIACINETLAGLKFTGLRIEDSDGYLCTERTYDPDGHAIGVSCRYGFDRCVLAGCLEDEEQHVYQMDAVVADGPVNHDECAASWRVLHPDRVMRVVRTVEFEERMALIVLHHER